jgi:hypothetical protein
VVVLVVVVVGRLVIMGRDDAAKPLSCKAGIYATPAMPLLRGTESVAYFATEWDYMLCPWAQPL